MRHWSCSRWRANLYCSFNNYLAQCKDTFSSWNCISHDYFLLIFEKLRGELSWLGIEEIWDLCGVVTVRNALYWFSSITKSIMAFWSALIMSYLSFLGSGFWGRAIKLLLSVFIAPAHVLGFRVVNEMLKVGTKGPNSMLPNHGYDCMLQLKANKNLSPLCFEFS